MVTARVTARVTASRVRVPAFPRPPPSLFYQLSSRFGTPPARGRTSVEARLDFRYCF